MVRRSSSPPQPRCLPRRRQRRPGDDRARVEAAEREREEARIRAAAEAEVRGLREALTEARRPFWRRWFGS
jgi:hypothetical protein